MGVRGRVMRRVAAVVSIAVVVTVAGCGVDEPAPRLTSAAAPPQSSPTPSPSPTVELWRLPEQPAAMSEPTTDGAVAAATHMLQLYGYTFATRDTGPWRQMALDTCTFCSAVTAAVDEMAAAGHKSSGSRISVDSTRSVEISEDRWFSVDLKVTQGSSERVDIATESVVASDPGGRYRAVFALSWADRWRVDEMGFIELDADEAAAG